MKAGESSPRISTPALHQNSQKTLNCLIDGKVTNAVLHLVGKHLLGKRERLELQLLSTAKPDALQLLVHIS